MKGIQGFKLFVACVALVTGCATYNRHRVPTDKAEEIERAMPRGRVNLSRDTEEQVLSLDPECVTFSDITNTLAKTPAPRIINIHGGVLPVHLRMISFSEFLVGMGFPRMSITNPADGTYTFSCWESSTKIAGYIAWHYEKEGLRPMIVGHSQGGFQAIKILRKLAGLSGERVAVWNPLTWQPEPRYEIVDPLTGQLRPVVGLQLPYATAVGSGGLARALPNQWSMFSHLRTIPDSVEEFTGFYKGLDLLGGDFLGYGPANAYHASGTAKVRNIRLPEWYRHGSVPDTRRFLQNREIVEWIQNYQPPADPGSVEKLEGELKERFGASGSRNMLWAAEVWFSIKKHWVLELQRAIQAKYTRAGGGAGHE